MSSSAALSVLLFLAVTTANPIVCPNLGSAANFAVVAYSGITNTGPSVIKGNLAVYPIASVTGLQPLSHKGTTQLASRSAAKAHIDEISAYKYCKGVPYTVDMTGIDLAGKTLTPGVYKFASTAGITAAGILTLKGAGIYIFQVGSAITTGASSQIVATGGADAGCIYWQVGSSVTHGASSTFLGHTLAYASVTFGSGVIYNGSIYAQTGYVTIIDDTITNAAKCNIC